MLALPLLGLAGLMSLISIPSGGAAKAALPRSVTGAAILGTSAHRGLESSESVRGMVRFRRQMFDIRPAPERPEPEAVAVTPEGVTPAPEEAAAPEEAVAPAGSVTEIIYAAAAEHGLDGAYLVSVAECESGLDPGAVNSAGYYGLFQFDTQTWAAYGSGSIFDPAAQAGAAASLIAGGQASRWPNCA
ncbi:MAG: transglycosylase family protein [Actinomycetota bacterium]|nr:transglycosylase family protein [Actinomycetota bacterium]